MFCTSCGAEVADGTKFCPKCGASTGAVAEAGQAPQAQPQQQAPQYAQPQAQPQPYAGGYGYNAQVPGAVVANPQYKTMGGWLLFFMICSIIGVVATVFSIFGLVSTFGDLALVGLTGMGVVAIIGTIVGAVLIIMYIVGVFTKKANFLQIFQISMIVGIVVEILMLIMVSGSYVGYFLDASYYSQTIGQMIGSIIGCVLLTLYYCKSERVRTYMGSTEYAKKALFRFKA